MPESYTEPLGQSNAFLDFQETLSRAAGVDRPILLIGERGTGKELAAAKLHYLSQRWRGPLVALNCAALAPALLESELFGHEEGAFTGAHQRRTGRFEAATEGTLFLDEIAQIPTEVQEKILRVVEYGSFERVGSSQPVQVDARIIGATNADLPALARQGRFKRDLLDRLSFDVLFVPPLRVRREDILLLANHFATRMAHELGWESLPEFSRRVVAQMESYAWPGNVRELRNVVERAVYRSDTPSIDELVFDPFVPPFGASASDGIEAQAPAPSPSPSQSPSSPAGAPGGLDRSLEEAVRELEVRMIRESLAEARYNQRQAAKALGLTYHQFRGRWRKYREELAVEDE